MNTPWWVGRFSVTRAGLFPAVSMCEENFFRPKLFSQFCGTCEGAALASRASKSTLICQFTLEVKLQRELHQPRIADMQYLAKRPALVGYVAINGVELRVVPDIEDVGPELHLPSLSKSGLFGEAHVPVVDSRAAADRARGVANCSRCNRGVREQIRIEGITGNRLAGRERGINDLCQWTREGRAYRAPRVDCFEGADEVWLARRLEVKCGVELLNVILRGDADREAALETQNARYFPAIQKFAFKTVKLRHWQVPYIVENEAVPCVVI